MAPSTMRPAQKRHEAPQTVIDMAATYRALGFTQDGTAAELMAAEARGEIEWAPSARAIRDWEARGLIERPRRPDDPWSIASASAGPGVARVVAAALAAAPNLPWPNERQTRV